jgi:UDP-glucose 4-epimerase
MKFFVTGGAGFIGSHLVDRLISKGEVVVYDNLSLGKKEFIEQHLDKKNFKFYEADLLDLDKLKKAMEGCDVVWHLAANSNIKNNEKTDTDLKQGILATYNVLEAMRINRIKKIVFSSTSAIFGENPKMPTPEEYGPLFPISFYGASKLGAEGYITCFCHNFNMQAWIFRFANIVGSRVTHGAIFDFINKLKKNPKELLILGDGKQQKSYLEVSECVNSMLFAFEHAKEDINCFNLGCDSSTSVKKIADTVVKSMGLKDVKYKFTGKDRGWVGDVPKMSLDVTKINKLGWKAKLSSDQAVEKAVEDILK